MPRFFKHLPLAFLAFLPLLAASFLRHGPLVHSAVWMPVSALLISLLILLVALNIRRQRHLTHLFKLASSLEERLLPFHTAMQQAPLSMIITDTQANIQYVNPFMVKRSGYSEGELVGKNARMLSSGETSPDTYRQMWEQLSQLQPWNGRFSSRDKSGRSYLEQVWMAPVLDEDGNLRQFVSIKQDISEQQRTLEHIQMQNSALELLTHNAPLPRILDTIFASSTLDHSGLYPVAFLTSTDKQNLHLASAPALPHVLEQSALSLPIDSHLARTLTQSLSRPGFNASPDLQNPVHAAARADGMHSYWSEPVLEDSSGFLAGLVLYYRTSKSLPSSDELQLIGNMTDLIRLAVQRSQNLALLQLAETVYHNSNEALAVNDANGVFITVNPAFTRITGFSQAEIIGKDFTLLHSNQHDATFYERMNTRLEKKGRWKGEIWARRKNGELYPQFVSISNTYNADGSVRFRVSLFADISQQKANEEQIWRQANFDSLTGIANRRFFISHLEHAIHTATRQQQRLGLLFIDLDKFKPINDRYGHRHGDHVLQEVAQRIQKQLREADFCARLGGDEFVVLLEGNPDLEAAMRIAQRIKDSVEQVITLDGIDSHLSLSCGISFFPQHANTAEKLIHEADNAMYQAKREGRSQVIVSAAPND